MITETREYMTFKPGDELFAIDVAQVREVLEVPQITKVPTAPDYMRGVIELHHDGEATVLGGLADSVHEVIELDPGNIHPPPRIAMRWRTDFIQGMGKRGDDFIIILDANAVFSSQELALVSDTVRRESEPIPVH
jgi:purine-binding chemotaxis protein CheW